MASETLYLKLERNIETQTQEIRMKDLGKLYCRNGNLLNRAKVMKVMRFTEADGGRKVISVMKLIVGETEVIVEQVKVSRNKGFWVKAKICFVAGICFFGAAFTIMAFHNDISVVRVFNRIYEMVTGMPSDGMTVLEVSYSIGLALGIVVFFNHIGGRRITKDPTPIEVEMRVYEDQVNTALAETADREKKTLDVE